jgi:hypothetical protein
LGSQIRDLQRNEKGNEPSSKIISEESVSSEELQEEIKSLIEENESLRKGMNEILESVRAQDGNGKHQ